MNGHDAGHEAALDSVALLALGVLPEAEARAVAGHAAHCAECSAEYAELRSTADAVGVGAEVTAGWSAADAARLKARIFAGIGEYRNGAAVLPPLRPAASVASLRRSPWLPYLAAAAALVFAVVSSTNLVTLRSEQQRSAEQIRELHAELGEQTRAADRAASLERDVAALTAPASRHYPISMGEVVASDGRLFLAMRLGDLPAGKVYQAWVLRAHARAMAPSVTFAAQSGVTLVQLPDAAEGARAVAVSVEPAGGSKAPTSKPAFVRSLS